jgi:hypothetical protein
VAVNVQQGIFGSVLLVNATVLPDISIREPTVLVVRLFPCQLDRQLLDVKSVTLLKVSPVLEEFVSVVQASSIRMEPQLQLDVAAPTLLTAFSQLWDVPVILPKEDS